MWTKPIDLDNTFCTHHVRTPVPEADMFGVEIELEGNRITVPIQEKEFHGFWAVHNDGSLRTSANGGTSDQAIEYVFRRPLNMIDTVKAVGLLETHLTKTGVDVHESGRTSVHVHVNVGNETMATVYNYITLAVIFDELLVSQNGRHRIGNNFCFRFKDAEGAIIDVANSIRQYGDLQGINTGNRYSSVNICSMFKFGTIEFRSLECTVNSARIMAWINVLQSMKEAARRFKNPVEIISQFSLMGVDRFFLSVLGAAGAPYVRVEKRHSMLFDGVRLAQDFANSSSWNPMSNADFKTMMRDRGYNMTDIERITRTPTEHVQVDLDDFADGERRRAARDAEHARQMDRIMQRVREAPEPVQEQNNLGALGVNWGDRPFFGQPAARPPGPRLGRGPRPLRPTPHWNNPPTVGQGETE